MYRLSNTVRSTHDRDGAVVLDVHHGRMFSLNVVGSRILQLLRDGHGEGAVVDGIVQDFGVSRELAESDVHEFIQVLKEYHIVQMQEASAAI
jgi:hypothetical protein